MVTDAQVQNGKARALAIVALTNDLAEALGGVFAYQRVLDQPHPELLLSAPDLLSLHALWVRRLYNLRGLELDPNRNQAFWDIATHDGGTRVTLTYDRPEVSSVRVDVDEINLDLEVFGGTMLQASMSFLDDGTPELHVASYNPHHGSAATKDRARSLWKLFEACPPLYEILKKCSLASNEAGHLFRDVSLYIQVGVGCDEAG